ncbi:hypothetical protein J3459_020103 [Metarhizium acridum]|uniref:LYC1 C-terminal domain-containing protein n=1 Tax=Metarhizium acridum (strain CQMa 102) TaxID=655827 RepID=E9DUF7_METAQ|nr:uncharacterized protein MAC_01255 [Metarhizium acridum CQMa 102]EFY92619.1 hypothetical protein MAC_01255 [Metarhizium acridum CQMa 102]KAG8405919.1 hypothetical protein J3459_020103 [Metarhizium acridum]KAG8424994.1 hypothetical protein J3458_001738 [Metarhizium acridum]
MSLPSATSKSLTLAKATKHERVYVWTRHQPVWGRRLTAQAYVDREEHLLTCQLTKDGGLTSWILTDPTSTDAHGAPSGRPILSAAETYRKRAIVRDPGGTVRDVTAYGIASVFTLDEFRRQGYAGRMFALLGETLAGWQAGKPGSAEFSILFSDIGKDFYANHQWMPFRSVHMTFPTTPFTTRYDDQLTLITGDNLQAIARLDEQTLRRKIADPPSRGYKRRVAILPDFATYEWHVARERFMCDYMLGKAPTVHGAIYTPADAPDSRVWMLWSNILYGGKEKPQDNVMNILHYAWENENMSDEDLSRALGAIMGLVHTKAQDWLCSRVDMWNPDERTQRLLENMTRLQGKLIVREKTNIPSLRWFGQGPVSEVEWVDNEKFEWC